MCSGISSSGLSAKLARACAHVAGACAAPAPTASECAWLGDAFKGQLGILICEALMASIAACLGEGCNVTCLKCSLGFASLHESGCGFSKSLFKVYIYIKATIRSYNLLNGNRTRM